MQKYRVVASKSQKKYTIIVSAENEVQAKEKIHHDGYSILSISLATGEERQGNKYIFQIEKNGEIKNGVIYGNDIYKVYKKLIYELGYTLIYLYPEGDEAENSAEKKQLIMEQLKVWYELQQHKEHEKTEKKSFINESFHIKKELEKIYIILEKVTSKLDYILSHSDEYIIEPSMLMKLQRIYEKIKHIKKSTNLSKLKEVGELALTKIWEIELASISGEKDIESQKLLDETNSLLKEIGSRTNFKQDSFNIFRELKETFKGFRNISAKNIKSSLKPKKKQVIDKDSYSFLKTVLLLEKYKEKLKLNSRELKELWFEAINIFSHSEKKEKLLLKRKVIQQNISILKAKKTGNIGSYTSLKKWYKKISESFRENERFLSSLLLLLCLVFISLFLIHVVTQSFGIKALWFNMRGIEIFLSMLVLYIILQNSKNLLVFPLWIVFLSFFYIFMSVNF